MDLEIKKNYLGSILQEVFLGWLQDGGCWRRFNKWAGAKGVGSSGWLGTGHRGVWFTTEAASARSGVNSHLGCHCYRFVEEMPQGLASPREFFAYTPPWWEQWGGGVILCWLSSCFNFGQSTFSIWLHTPTKFVPWSDRIVEHCPPRDLNLLRAFLKPGVTYHIIAKRWIARDGRHTKMKGRIFLVSAVLRVVLPSVVWNGPNKAKPICAKNGVHCSPREPRSFRHRIQLLRTISIIVLPNKHMCLMIESLFHQLLSRLEEQLPLEGAFSIRGSVFHQEFSEGTRESLAVSAVALRK